MHNISDSAPTICVLISGESQVGRSDFTSPRAANPGDPDESLNSRTPTYDRFFQKWPIFRHRIELRLGPATAELWAAVCARFSLLIRDVSRWPRESFPVDPMGIG